MTKDEAYHRVVRAVKEAYPDQAEEIIQKALPPIKGHAYRLELPHGGDRTYISFDNARKKAKELLGTDHYGWEIEEIKLYMRFDEQLIETFNAANPQGDGFREDTNNDEI